MITLFIIILIYKLLLIKKAWKHSKALCDRKYVTLEIKDGATMYLVVLVIFGIINLEKFLIW